MFPLLCSAVVQLMFLPLNSYCDCFAAGMYCVEPCSCQGCLNRPQYEQTVLETRQQIESRNPLAFAPKIIESGGEFSANNRVHSTLDLVQLILLQLIIFFPIHRKMEFGQRQHQLGTKEAAIAKSQCV